MIDTYFDMMDQDRDEKLSMAELKNGFVGLRFVTLKIIKVAAAPSNHKLIIHNLSCLLGSSAREF